MEKLEDAKWVAETFGIPLLRVYELSRKGVIPTVRILRQYRYDPEALAEWVKNGGTEKTEQAEAAAFEIQDMTTTAQLRDKGDKGR